MEVGGPTRVLTHDLSFAVNRSLTINPYTTLTKFSTKQIVVGNVYTDVGGIK